MKGKEKILCMYAWMLAKITEQKINLEEDK